MVAEWDGLTVIVMAVSALAMFNFSLYSFVDGDSRPAVLNLLISVSNIFFVLGIRLWPVFTFVDYKGCGLEQQGAKSWRYVARRWF